MVTVNAKTLSKAVKTLKTAWNYDYKFDKYLLFEVKNCNATLSATACNHTNYTASVLVSKSCDSALGFTVLLDAKQLTDALKHCKKTDMATLDTDGHLSIDSMTAKINTRSNWADIYPKIDPPRLSCDLIGTISDIDRLSWVAMAMSTDSTRCNLNSICIDGSTMVATDGHRMHMDFELAQMCKDIGREQIMIDRMAVESALLFKPVSIAIVRTAKWIGLVSTDSDGAVLTSYTERELGCFPDYRQVMPDQKKRRDIVTVSGKSLSNACLIMKTTKKEERKGHKYERGCIFEINGKIDCKCGEKTMSLAYESRESEKDLTVCFNPRYLADACMNDDLVQLMIPETEYEASSVSSGYQTAVVMPMRF